MAKRKPLSYQEKLNAIKAYTHLGINSRKYSAKNPNFSREEKWLISRYYNLSREKGYFEYDAKNNEFTEKVKLVKSKKKKQKAAPRFDGYFMPGAAPDDKIKNGKIIKKNFTKTLIPMDFNDLPPDDESGEFDEAVYQEIYTALFGVKMREGDYFTIVLQNGWELGQKKTAEYKKNHKAYKEGQAIARDLSGDKKFMNLADKIIEQLKQGLNKYKMGRLGLVAGVYLWEFKNQREPTAQEKKAIRGRKKRKRK